MFAEIKAKLCSYESGGKESNLAHLLVHFDISCDMQRKQQLGKQYVFERVIAKLCSYAPVGGTSNLAHMLIHFHMFHISVRGVARRGGGNEGVGGGGHYSDMGGGCCFLSVSFFVVAPFPAMR